ncbi:MAG: cyclic nucleotide-binding domain-containing protein [Myxococcota bacterium]|nr:cyclic nucleotide-binding domain-containing protein [Myxococcota bacterium]
MLETRRFKAGETIIRENDFGETAYIVQKGQVEISREVDGKAMHLATLGPGETIGEMSMIDDKPRSATAVAVGDCELTEIHHDDFFEALQTDPQASIMILKALFERLRDINSRFLQLQAGSSGAAGDVEQKDQAAGLALCLEPVSNEAAEALPATSVRIDRFPFRIGRESHNPLVHNDLELKDDMPWQISRHHVAFVLDHGKVGVVDRGSKLGTAVDGRRLGGHGGEPGPVFFSGNEGTLLLGNEKSPYEFRVTIESSR